MEHVRDSPTVYKPANYLLYEGRYVGTFYLIAVGLCIDIDFKWQKNESKKRLMLFSGLKYVNMIMKIYEPHVSNLCSLPDYYFLKPRVLLLLCHAIFNAEIR